MSLTESADGLTRNWSYDLDGNGSIDRSRSDVTTLGDDGSRTRTVTNSDSRGNSLNSETTNTSGDGLTTITTLDLDGDGTVNYTTDYTTVLNLDGTKTETWVTKDGAGAVIAQSERSTSANQLHTTQTDDFDGNGSSDRVTETHRGASGGFAETDRRYDAAGTLIRATTTVLSADERTRTVTLDRNGDGVIDQETLTEIDLSGNTTTTYKDLASDGSTEAQIVKTVSANSASHGYTFDNDGDSAADVSRSTEITYEANGDKVETFEERDGGGRLTFQSTTTTSADGLTSTTTIDQNGDGEIDSRGRITTTLNEDGSKTNTGNDWFSNGVARSGYEETVSADGKTISNSYDFDGDGRIEKTVVSVTENDGSVTVTETGFNEYGTVFKTAITKTSSDGLTTTIERDGVTQTISRSTIENGSYTWENGVEATATDTHLRVSHEIDTQGLETWTLLSTIDGTTTSSTARLDASAIDRVLSEAAALYDAAFDREMDRSESEVLVKHISDAQLNLAGLAAELLSSDEYSERYGELTDTGFIARAYQNTFGRSPELEELSGHLSDLSDGTVTRAKLLAELSLSAEHMVVGNSYGDTKNYDVFLLPLQKEEDLSLDLDTQGLEFETNEANIKSGTNTDDTLENTDAEALIGLDGNDILVGKETDEALIGGTGEDRLIGKEGDDELAGGKGGDTLQGGDGNDSYYYSRGDGHDVIEDSGSTLNDDGEGGDVLVFGEGISLQDLDIQLVGDDLLIDFRNPSAEDAAKATELGLAPLDGSITIKDWALSEDNRIESLKFADASIVEIGARNFIMAGSQGAFQLTNVDSPVSREFRDLNGDGAADAVLTTDDGRIWTRLADKDGGFGDAEVQGTGAGLNKVQKTGGSGSVWDAGAVSKESFVGSGSVITYVEHTNAAMMLGLSVDGHGTDHATIDYALYFAGSNHLYVYENGTSRGHVEYYAIGDEFTVERLDNGNVQYTRNGSVFYTSSIVSSPETPLNADVSIHSMGNQIGQTRLKTGDETLEPVTWVQKENLEVLGFYESVSTNFSDLNGDGIDDAILAAEDGRIWTRLGNGEGGFAEAVTQDTGQMTNRLVRTSGHSDWDAGAYSEENFTGSGSVSMRAVQVGNIMVGLSSDGQESHYYSIDYAIHLTSSSTVYVYEGGLSQGHHTSYVVGDEFSVERQVDGTVQYLKNGVVFYTSAVVSDPTQELAADVSIHGNGTQIGDTWLQAGNASPKLVAWKPDANLEHLGLNQSISTEFVDLNGDGNKDAVLTSDSGKVWTRLGDGEGNFGEATALETGLMTNRLFRTGGHSDWDAGAYSEENFTGSGSVSMRAVQVGNIMVGLSSDGQESHYYSIDYAIHLTSSSTVYVYEGGLSQGHHTSYVVGDEFSVERQVDGTVQYLKNGVVFYTSAVVSDPTQELAADVSVHGNGTQVGDTWLQVGNASPKLVTWKHDTKLELRGLNQPVSTELMDVNGDGYTDIVLTSQTAEIWTRLGDGQGGFGDATKQGLGFLDNGLIKSSGVNSSWDGGAFSVEKFTGAGSVATKVVDTNVHLMFGLSEDGSDPHYNGIQYGIYQTPSKLIYVYESSVQRGSFGSYAADDVLSVERRSDGVVEYLKNGEVFYTSSVLSPTGSALQADLSIYTNGGRLGPVLMTDSSGKGTEVTWITNGNLTLDGFDETLNVDYLDTNSDGSLDAVISSENGEIWTRLGDGQGGFATATEHGDGIESNALKKTATDGWTHGAYSEESFTGAGSISTVAERTDNRVMLGLSTDGYDSGYADIDYAILLSLGGQFSVYENASSSGVLGTYVVGDKFEIERLADGTVQYLKNGEAFRTSSVVSDTTVALVADLSVYDVNAQVGDVFMKSGGGSEELVIWHADSGLERIGTDGDVSVQYKDINNDNVSDAVLTAEDGRIWTRFGDGAGGFGETFGQGDGTNALVKVSGGTDWNRGAYSKESFTGAGRVSTNAQQTDKNLFLGLSADGKDPGYASIDYGIQIHNSLGYLIYEGGTNPAGGALGNYSSGDEFAIERLSDGTVQYLRNDVVFYTSTVISDPATALKADLSVYLEGTIVGDVRLQAGNGPTQNVTWIADTGLNHIGLDSPVSVDYADLNNDGAVDAILSSDAGQIWTRLGDGAGGFENASEQGDGIQSNVLVKTSGGNGWNTGSTSVETLAGTGRISTVILQNDMGFAVGLSVDGGDAGYSSIDYCIHPNSLGNVHVYENGLLRGSYGSYAIGDVFSIERLSDGTIQYLKNGELLYTSTIISNPDVSLVADTSVYHVGAQIGDVLIQSGDEPAKFVTWNAASNLELIGTEGSVEANYMDVDDDGILDVVIGSSDGRSWVRLGDGQGGFGAAIAQHSDTEGTNGDDLINAGGGNDLIYGRSGDDIIFAGSGDDEAFGHSGNDTIYGQAGADSLSGQEGDDTLSGGAGDDILYGGDGDDNLDGGEGTDRIHGGGGSNRFSGGQGLDYLYGGGGDDIYTYNRGDGNDVILESSHNTEGDGISFGEGIAFEDLKFSKDGNHLKIAFNTETAEEAAEAAARGLDALEGSILIKDWFASFNNKIDYVTFANGEKYWINHIDSFQAAPGSSNDLNNSGEGDDTVNGGAGHDTLLGDKGDDILLGEAGNDTLVGGAGDDHLLGGEGDDFLDAGEGADGWQRLEGNAGDDTYVLGTNQGKVAISELADQGSDRIFFTGMTFADLQVSNYDYSLGGTNPSIEPDALVFKWVNGSGASEFWVNDGGTHVELYEFADGMTVSSVKVDEGGNFVLKGNEVDNLIIGQAGDDRLEGDAGNDTYRLTRDSGNDTIVDTAGVDRLELGDDIKLEDLRVHKSTDQLKIDVLADDGSVESSVTITGWDTESNRIEKLVFSEGDEIDLARFVATQADDPLLTPVPQDLTDLYRNEMTATQSSTYGGQGAANVLDNNLSNNSHTQNGAQEWLQIDLGEDRWITEALFHNRTTEEYRINGAVIKVTDKDGNELFQSAPITNAGSDEWVSFKLPEATKVRFVRLEHSHQYLHPTEFKALGFDGAEIPAVWLDGEATNDVLTGMDGNDQLIGRAGDDTLEGGKGADTLVGGLGSDWTVYASSIGGIEVDLSTGAGTGGEAEGDTLTGIENVRGSATAANILTGDAADNELIGGAEADQLSGGAGDDILEGGAGADTLSGGEGSDWANYSASTGGVTVNLSMDFNFGGDAEGDVLSGIENIEGSNSGADVLTGNANDNHLNGGGGNDWFAGGAGADRIDGGVGLDWSSYTYSDAAVTVNLADGLAELGGHAEGDVLSGIEKIAGSSFNDILTGDSNNNSLSGMAGSDTLSGGDGDDWITGGAGADTIDGGAGLDWSNYTFSDAAVTVNLADGLAELGGHAEGDVLSGIEKIAGSSFNDILTGDSNNNSLSGKAGSDTLSGGDGDDWITGGAGADTINGDAGLDWSDYSDSDSAVTVNLADGLAERGGHAEGDVLSGIEKIAGSSFNDALTGDGNGNTLSGRDGNDSLKGAAGSDLLKGSAGDDMLFGHYWGSSGSASDIDTAVYFGLASDYAISTYFYTDAARSTPIMRLVVEDLAGTGSDGTDEGRDELQDIDVLKFQNGQLETEDLFALLPQNTSVTLRLGTGNGETLTGAGTAADFIAAGAGNDTLLGLSGNDWLLGGAGDDILEGGAGADTLSGGEGSDWANYSASTDGVTVNLTVEFNFGGDAEGDVLSGVENIEGSKTGADVLTGDANDNHLIGGGGDDILSGEGGNDILDGGEGADTFVFGAGFGHDKIRGFQAGQGTGDKVQLKDGVFADFAAVINAAVEDGDSTVLTLDGDNSLTLENTRLAELHQDNFQLL